MRQFLSAFSVWRAWFPVVAVIFAAVHTSLPGQTPPASAVGSLHAFTRSIHGGAPKGPLVQAADGTLYGTTSGGGANGRGTIFRIGPDGKDFTVVRAFAESESQNPNALLLGADGRLYGSTGLGGFRNAGNIYTVKRDGMDFTTLQTFNTTTDGALPGPLLEGADGRLYGVTQTGGTNGVGTIFRVGKDGAGFTVLRHLAAADGSSTTAGLVQASDGRLYGVSEAGGTNGRGTIFGINPDGTNFAVLRHLNLADGTQVRERLLFVGGRLYGTAPAGGTFQYGTVFRLNPDGSDFLRIHSFGGTADGATPYGSLVVGPNGLLLGATYGGGRSAVGVIFRVRRSDDTVAALEHLQFSTGAMVGQTLLWGADQKIYGLSNWMGSSSDGGIFVYSPLPQFTSSSTVSGIVGRFVLHQLAASGSVTGFTATGLPPGLAVRAEDGEISGTATQAGVYAVTVGAANEIGTGTGTLTFTIAKGTAAVTLSNLTQGYDGKPKPVTVVTTPAGLSTATTYNGSATVPTDPGLYEVRTTITDANYNGTATANLLIGVSGPAVSAATVSGVVLNGVSAKLSVTAGGSPPFTYRWQRREVAGSAFVDIADGAVFAGATAATLTILSPTLAMNGDQFRCIVTNAQGSATGAALTLSVLPGSRLANISIRASVAATQPIVVGFVTNAGARRVLIRAIGPGLAPFLGSSAGLAGDPALTLFNAAGGSAGANDNWAGTAALSTAFAAVGAFALPATSQDAALLADVNGAYTAQMKATATGLGLVEVYDISTDSALRTINFSTLYRVGTVADALVAGFVIAGTGTKTLLVRGIGPALQAFGVGDALADPKLELFDAAGVRVATNDDWAASLAPTFGEVGAFALAAGSRDSAFVVTVPPGLYSVQLSTGDGVAGQGLIEVYELPR